jgi:hypothetical protein
LSDGERRHGTLMHGFAMAQPTLRVQLLYPHGRVVCCMLYRGWCVACCMLHRDGRWLDLHSDSIARRQSWYSIAWCAAHNKQTTKLVPVRDEQTKQPKPPPVVLMALVAAAAAAAALWSPPLLLPLHFGRRRCCCRCTLVAAAALGRRRCTLVAAAAAAAAVADRLPRLGSARLGSARLGSRTPPRCGVCVSTGT